MDYSKNLKSYLKMIDEVIEKGPYKDNWDSLVHHETPDWYQKAKFGIFIHWGVFSVPAFENEWYPRWMYIEGSKAFEHHVNTYGSQKEFGYKNFIPMFQAEKFDADRWCDLFLASGAKFVMPVAEHHDGFQMYDSELSDWCASKMGPKKDILKALKTGCEKRNLVFTASSHRVEHYWFMNGGTKFDSDMPKEPEYGDLYWPSKEPFVWDKQAYIQAHQRVEDIKVDQLFMEDWLARTCEIVDKYQPKIMYFDWWIQVEAMKPYLKKFAAYYYNRAAEWGVQVTINYKFDAFVFGSGTPDIERGQLASISPYYWQNDTAVGKNSWSYVPDNEYKEPVELIQDLIDIVSKNGSLLLNIGPKADGSIAKQDAKILTEIGNWLKVNGEGIYGTSFYKKFGEGPTEVKEGHFTDTLRKEFTPYDFRFTYKDGTIYAFVMKWPEDGHVKINTLGRHPQIFNGLVAKAEILGYDGTFTYQMCDDYFEVKAEQLKANYPVCIKIVTE